MKELTNALKVDVKLKDKYDELKNSSLINLPKDIDKFIDYFKDILDVKDILEKKNVKDSYILQFNYYHLFNDIFQELKMPAAVAYFRENIANGITSQERIENHYKRFSETWISTSEAAELEITKFINFVDQLANLLNLHDIVIQGTQGQ